MTEIPLGFQAGFGLDGNMGIFGIQGGKEEEPFEIGCVLALGSVSTLFFALRRKIIWPSLGYLGKKPYLCSEKIKNKSIYD